MACTRTVYVYVAGKIIGWDRDPYLAQIPAQRRPPTSLPFPPNDCIKFAQPTPFPSRTRHSDEGLQNRLKSLQRFLPAVLNQIIAQAKKMQLSGRIALSGEAGSGTRLIDQFRDAPARMGYRATCPKCTSFILPQQIPQLDPQRMCDLLQSLERWLDVTIFNAGDVGHREPTGPGQLLLRKTPATAEMGDSGSDIHVWLLRKIKSRWGD